MLRSYSPAPGHQLLEVVSEHRTASIPTALKHLTQGPAACFEAVPALSSVTQLARAGLGDPKMRKGRLNEVPGLVTLR